MIAFSQLLEAGVAGLIEAVSALEAELKATKEDIAGLNERINRLENREPSHNEADLEALIDDRIDSFLSMRLDDEIEAHLSGREITVTL
jgi:flagellar motility protein MotE (MotC chaperone)